MADRHLFAHDLRTTDSHDTRFDRFQLIDSDFA
jgi:hypothetical protein